jgi:hypothetical protein
MKGFGIACRSRSRNEIVGPRTDRSRRSSLHGTASTSATEEGRSADAIGFLDKLNEGELRRAVDGDEKVELSLGSLHFGDVDVKKPDLNFFFGGLSPSTSTSCPIPCLCRQRCNDDRVRCGMVGCSA